jgi:glycosyltransferase involved in cell wall biosynthesis
MKMNKFLIILAYYERPTIVLNSLRSILNIGYPEFEVHFIDDGSTNKGEPIVRDVCSSIIDKFKFDYIDNSIEQKKSQGGSIHGKYLNKAIYESDADHVIILCDDDAIYPDFLTKLNIHINKEVNKDKKYFYHNMVLYDSLNEPYENGIERKDLSYFTNQWKTPINCGGKVDSTQVTYSRPAFVESELTYPAPQTAGLDETIFNKMSSVWGLCEYSGLISQLKSNNADNLVWKDMNKNKDVIYQTKDMK